VRYAKKREGSHRKTSQTINGRVLVYSVLEAIALVATALFQVRSINICLRHYKLAYS